MKECKSFRLVPYRYNEQVESHENWAILSLFLWDILILAV